MREFVLEKVICKSCEKGEEIKSPVNEQFVNLFEKSEEKLKEDLNEYSKAYSNAANYYVK